MSFNHQVQQIELTFAPVAELREDTPRAIASVAHCGGGVYPQVDSFHSQRSNAGLVTLPGGILRNSKNKPHTLARLRDRVCQQCGKPFQTRNTHEQKYCSFACVGIRNRLAAVRPWEPEAIRLCKGEQRGFKSIAGILNVPANQVYVRLRRLGLLNQVLHRKSAYKRGRRAADVKKEKTAFNKTLRLAWRSEWSHALLLDESMHWGRHPDKLRWMSNKVAASQFEKWKHDPLKKLKRAMRTRLWKVLKLQLQNKNQRKTFSAIGCDPEALVIRLESQFTAGMDWNNFGTYWEVDHIRPCSSFDLSKPSELNKCFHFSNLQPLQKSENRKKSSWFQDCHHKHKGAKLIYEKAA
jgi:hypothetical protein